MKKWFILKISLILLGSCGLLILAYWAVIQSGITTKRVNVLPPRERFAAAEIKEDKPDVNVRVTKFEVKSKEADGFFRKGKPIEVSCTYENDSEKGLKSSVKFLMRTSTTEIKAVKQVIGAKKQLELNGTFTPDAVGVVIFACRADVDRQLLESDENDNREIVTVYVSE